MPDYFLPQNDTRNPGRAQAIAAMKQKYFYDMTYGVPTSNLMDPVLDGDGPVWVSKVLAALVGIRYNIYYYLRNTSAQFAHMAAPSIREPQKFVGWLNDALKSSKFSQEAFDYFSPNVGYGESFSRASSTDDYKRVFTTQQIPDIANHFETDETFGRTFVSGPNPVVLQRLNQIPDKFPITDEHFHKVQAFQGDSLKTAIQQGRIFYCDYAKLSILTNGKYREDIPKYTYAPLVAFAVAAGGGPLLPFAIQCGQSPQGRQIYTPVDGFSWRIARNCVLVAHNTHHEVLTHLGHTHLLMEPVAVAIHRNFAPNHPVGALLKHHVEGTILINNGATHTMIQPGGQVEQLIGADIRSAYPLLATEWLGYSFTGHYLPAVFARNQTTDTSVLADYPYRDDGLLVWNAIASWTTDFVNVFYNSDATVQKDTELQSWALEMASPAAGRIKDFGATPGSIATKQDLSNILTMLIWTASAQHAAVNYSQLTDMAFAPANPLAGYTPEPTGLGHTEQDYLANLPPLEVAVCMIEILSLLGGVHYTTLGTYTGLAALFNGLEVDFCTGPIYAAMQRFQANLAQIEQQITTRNASRKHPYIHLLPSRIPQSVNI